MDNGLAAMRQIEAEIVAPITEALEARLKAETDPGPRILLPIEARQKISSAWAEICRRYKSPVLRALDLDAVIAKIRFEYPECFNATGQARPQGVACTDGLGVAVSPAPTSEDRGDRHRGADWYGAPGCNRTTNSPCEWSGTEVRDTTCKVCGKDFPEWN